MRVNLRVYPASVRTEVGGRYGTSEPPRLIVRVTAPAVDGRANAAVVEAMAQAFALKRSEVTLVTGSSNRNKVVELRRGDLATLTALLTR
jgi:uncharacterized protein (TIGR00251 family)